MRAVARGAEEIVAWWPSAATSAFLRISDLSGRTGSDTLDGCGWRRIEIGPHLTSYRIGGLTGGRLYWVELLDAAGAPFDAAPPVETPRRSGAASPPLPRLDLLTEALYGRS